MNPIDSKGKQIDLLSEIELLAAPLGYSSSEIASELIQYLRQRVALLLSAPSGQSERLKREFFQLVFDRSPTDIELEQMNRIYQRVPFSAEIQLTLLRLQGNRCASCGATIRQKVSPQVDHKVPLSLGGSNAISNLQILCGDCNLGKSNFLGWPLAAPFYQEHRGSKTVRFFVLSRAKHQCQYMRCSNSARNSRLRIHYRIPATKGGRWTLDNLRAYCDDHYHTVAMVGIPLKTAFSFLPAPNPPKGPKLRLPKQWSQFAVNVPSNNLI